ncbi:MAG: aminotransferase class V-fold PLP-dependent enzyme [Pseudomonadota bacterium]
MQVGETIYLDYQASTPVDDRVVEAMSHATRTLFANPHSADHALGWQAAVAIKEAAQKVGNLFGLQGDDVVFTSGASEANAMVFRSAQNISKLTNRNAVLVGAGDHWSVLNEAENAGLVVQHIALDRGGAPDANHLKNVINEQTALVSIIGVNNENGAITDLRAIAEICSRHGVLLHVDLSQAPLALDIDLLELDVGLATISAHKLYGPKGVGALLTLPGMSKVLRPVIVGAGQQAGLRGGTQPTELIVGFGEACRILGEGGAAERRMVANLRDSFVMQLQEKGIAELVGVLNHRHPGNALMRFPGFDASDLLARFQPQIAASSQSACSSGSIETSHVLRAMDWSDSDAAECIRFSFGRFSTEGQVIDAVSIISNTIDKMY